MKTTFADNFVYFIMLLYRFYKLQFEIDTYKKCVQKYIPECTRLFDAMSSDEFVSAATWFTKRYTLSLRFDACVIL